MPSILLSQFKTIRNWSIGVAEELSEEIAATQPNGFNNTIKWHLRHIITEAEYFMLELPQHSVQLPSVLFSPGTKPVDWDGELPSLSELVSTLKARLARINKNSPEGLNQPLKEPVHEFITAVDAAAFSVLHESLHLRQIMAMKQIIASAK
ncbi:DinB family protein [Metabacillus sp. KIGAM252]|uniref:DinB family protein n=1 Tax=Metabacillus flavus TaxID=2823519 RepID=A0ABS5LBP9_9BACI|nr:DinB family protein [Metabacillus flavus]MBS2968155.1 DinB family protein [Metabacillus flavus]